jgi:hypothetical protein
MSSTNLCLKSEYAFLLDMPVVGEPAPTGHPNVIGEARLRQHLC